MKGLAIVLAAITLLVTVSVALTQSSASFVLPSHVVAGGGERSISGNYAVAGTVGQASASPPHSASASFRLASGYWAGIQAATPPPGVHHRIYVPLIQRGSN